MGVIGLAFRAELRHRWRSWLAVALLVAVVGGVVLAAAAAGRRTSAAFPGYVALHGFDAEVYAVKPYPVIEHLPGVVASTELIGPDNGPPTCTACTRPIDPTNFGLASLRPGGITPDVLVSGRLPDQGDPDQVLASVTLQSVGVHVGSSISVPLYAASQVQAYNTDATPPPPRGPVVHLKVTGFEATEVDFPTGGAPNYLLYTTRAFATAVLPRVAAGAVYFVRLRGGAGALPRFEAEVTGLHAQGSVFVQSEDQQVSAVEASIHPQAVGWWLLAGLALLVGVAVVGQALARQSTVDAEDYPALRALGMERRQLVGLATVRNLSVAVAGALGALVIATALSPVAPLGEARWAEESTGIRFDPLVLPLGFLGLIALVVALGVWPAARAARARTDERSASSRSSAVIGALGALGAPPSMLVGVRSALERRRGGSSVPVGSALTGTVAAVVALCGTGVFAASLGHLTSTPALYGDRFALNISNGGDGSTPAPALLRTLRHDPAVTGITQGYALPAITIGGQSVGAIAGIPLEGPLLLSTVSGRLPGNRLEVGLGATTMRAVGAHVGSVVKVTVDLPSNATRSAMFSVVGQVSFPVVGNVVGLGTGSVFNLDSFERAFCPSGRSSATCREFAIGNGGGLLVSVVPGARGEEAVRRYLARDPALVSPAIVPTSLVNFGEAVNFPVIFGAMLAVFGAATLLHLLVVSVARRRRDVGLLKVIGFVNLQVASAVAWQATTLALVGIAIGVPVGLAAGQALWRTFASNLGAVPVAVVPVALTVVLAVGVAVVANLMAVGPALAATRARPGELLRTA